MENWDEVRTAYQVARIGTVSGAAAVLGVHHATVIRHIDALEARLGARLFQRHPRGYTATEAGLELLKVAQATEDQFAHLAARISGTTTEISGELVVTSIPGISDLVTPALVRLQGEHPGLRVRLISDHRLFQLEYGEAHVAIRAGARPKDSDNVVQPFCTRYVALCASPAYVAAHGLPKDEADLGRHRFVGPTDPEGRAPFHRWLAEHVPEAAITFRTNEAQVAADVIRTGAAMGFLPAMQGRAAEGLDVVMPSRPEWETPLWLVTHVDLHRAPRIQLLLRALKDEIRRMGLG